MGINHRGFDIGMAKKLLHRANVVAVLEQMGSDGVAEGVTTDALDDATGANGLVEGFLDTTGMEEMTIGKIMAIVFFNIDRRKDVLPAPCSSSVGIFFDEGEGEGDLAIALIAIALIGILDDAKVVLEGLDQFLGEGDEAIFAAFARSPQNLGLLEVNVFDA